MLGKSLTVALCFPTSNNKCAESAHHLRCRAPAEAWAIDLNRPRNRGQSHRSKQSAGTSILVSCGQMESGAEESLLMVRQSIISGLVGYVA
jgi:hypothetical protein